MTYGTGLRADHAQYNNTKPTTQVALSEWSGQLDNKRARRSLVKKCYIINPSRIKTRAQRRRKTLLIDKRDAKTFVWVVCDLPCSPTASWTGCVPATFTHGQSSRDKEEEKEGGPGNGVGVWRGQREGETSAQKSVSACRTTGANRCYIYACTKLLMVRVTRSTTIIGQHLASGLRQPTWGGNRLT